MTDPIRVLIADDHPVVRQGLAALLIPRNGFALVGEATDGEQAVKMARALQPDVILMDVVMPRMTGVEATVHIKAENPRARILVLTSFGERDDVADAIRAGAAGYMLKDSEPEALLHAIRSVHRGQFIIPHNLAASLTSTAADPPPPEQAKGDVSNLTTRERQVLAGVADGLTNQEIAEKLEIGTNTVRSHVSSMLQKLNLANRTQLAIYALEEWEGDA